MAQTYSPESDDGRLIPNTSLLGMWVFLACVVMLFASFVSALLVRSVGIDWQTSPLPSVLWWNTIVIISSSASFEMGRRRLQRVERGATTWWSLTLLLGVLFLGGQLWAWKELYAAGYLVSSNPHSSFFYILTGLHGLHLISSLLLVSYLMIKTASPEITSTGRRHLAQVTATYWHFLTLLWLVLFGVLYFWI